MEYIRHTTAAMITTCLAIGCVQLSFAGGAAAGMPLPQIVTITPADTVVEQYGKFEVALVVSAQFDNPYDYEQVTVAAEFVAPTGSVAYVDGFFIQDYDLNESTGALIPFGPGGFRVRFAPTQEGIWRYLLSATDQAGTVRTDTMTFICTAVNNPRNHGFIGTSGTNYLRFDDDTQYIPIGENIAWQNNNAFLDYHAWLSNLSENGGNFFRLWHAHWGLGIEWEPGWNNFAGLRRYQQANSWYQDWMLDYCADNGVYVMMCLQHHGPVSTQVNPNWNDSPYNSANGGPCDNTWEFFTNAEAIAHTKNRFRYIVARWGYAKNIMAWELFNEVLWTDNFETYQLDVADWHIEMGEFLKSIDPNDHLVTTSYGSDNTDPLVWGDPSCDITQTHFYINTPHIERALTGGIQSYLKEFGKPHLTGEFGLGGSANLANADPDGIHIHNALWATLMGGGLGSAMSWWWDNYIHPRDLYYHFKGVNELAEGIDFIGNAMTSTAAYVTGAPGDLTLTPTLGWGELGELEIVIDEKGQTDPDPPGLGSFLYGSQWNTQYRSPPSFVVDYPEAGIFTVRTGNDAGMDPEIAIYLDDALVLQENGITAQEYVVNVSAGPHVIKVDNTGTDWIIISSYVFSGLGSKVDAYALRSSDGSQACGWVLNEMYNHAYVTDQGVPPAVTTGMLNIEDIADGTYAVDWYDCLSGVIVSSTAADASKGILSMAVPELYWDLAFTVSSDPVGTRDLAPGIEPEVYPNPVTSGAVLYVALKYPADGEVNVTLRNVEGKPLHQAKTSGMDLANNGLRIPTNLPAGMYLLNVLHNNVLGSVPFVIVGE